MLMKVGEATREIKSQDSILGKRGVRAYTIFYTVGIIFLFIAIAFFSREFIFMLADSIKIIILFLLSIAFFNTGEAMRDKNI